MVHGPPRGLRAPSPEARSPSATSRVASCSTCPTRRARPEDTPAPPRFLPEYDNLLLSHDDRSRFIDRDYRDRLGWKGTLLVDGLLRGAWRIRDKALTVELFEPVDPPTRRAIAEEAERLVAFARTGFGPLELRFADA